MLEMIQEESNFGEDSLLSFEEFLKVPVVITDDILNVESMDYGANCWIVRSHRYGCI